MLNRDSAVADRMGCVGLELLLGLYVSLVLQKHFKPRGVARAIALFPYLIPTIVAVLV